MYLAHARMLVSRKEGSMKKDAEVLMMKRERHKGKTQEQAAAASGMSTRTLRTYEQGGVLPSERKHPHTWRTRANPFAQDWPWIVAQLERDPALQATTLFALLCQQHPGRYQPSQLRTLQRHIAIWRAEHGPAKTVIFPQQHHPGERAESDFTDMNALHITIAGTPFPHKLFHMVLTYSNVEAVSLCFAESFESLAAGIEAALWAFGGVPHQHRTDHLGAAIKPLARDEQDAFRAQYAALMAHYGMRPTMNTCGVAHENGDVEQAHHRLKQAIDQALRVRGSRDFPDRDAYRRWLTDLVRQRNVTRQARWQEEQAALQPLPAQPLDPCHEETVRVSRFSTIRVQKRTYSVPARLIGVSVRVQVRGEVLTVYHHAKVICTLPRLRGDRQEQIDYRHIIESLVRKPGAFAHYRYREELFPRLVFRQAYDALVAAQPARADREYVQVLYLAAMTSECEVATALTLLHEAGSVPTVSAVRALIQPPQVSDPLALPPPVLDLQPYDSLLGSSPPTGGAV
jgi:hypothetical protein